MSAESQPRFDARAPAVPATSLLLWISVAWALPMSALALGSPRTAVVALGAVGGAVALAWMLALAADRTVPALLVVFFLALSIPIDKYFAFQPHVGGWPGLRVSAADLLLIALLPACAALRWIGDAKSPFPRALPPLLLLTGLQYVAATVTAPNRALAVFEIASMVHAALIAWVVALALRRSAVPLVLAAIAAQVVVHTAVAFAQVATGRPIGAGILGGSDTLMTEALAAGARLRPSGLFVHPIVYADFLFLALPLTAAATVFTRATWPRLGFGFATAIGLAGLALTLSRGAWLSGLVVAVGLLVLALRARLVDGRSVMRLVPWAVALALVGAVAFGPRVYERLTGSATGNVDVRLQLNAIALRMIADSPFVGQGLNAFAAVMPRFDPANVAATFPAPAHNLYLLEASEAGIGATVLLLAVFLTVIVHGVGALRTLADPVLRWTAAAVVAGLIGLLISQLADFSLRLEPLRSFVWGLIGLLFGVVRLGEHFKRGDLSPRPSGQSPPGPHSPARFARSRESLRKNAVVNGGGA